ncbi:hypothetical protein [Ferruginibacter sp.]
MYGLTIEDWLLFPLYLYVVFFIFKKIRIRYAHNPILFKYFTWAFYTKIIFILIYTLLVCYVIFGDSVSLFFEQGKHFLELSTGNNGNIGLLFTNGGKQIDELADNGYKGYLAIESNYLVVKICAVLCFFTFSKYLIINLICGFIAFLGSWQLFKFFYSLYPQLSKPIAIACMGIPSVLFWSSGISKDTICIASIGFLTKSLYDIVIEKRHILLNTFIALLALYLTYTIKSYIVLSYLPFFFIFLIFKTINQTSNVLVKVAFKIFIPILVFVSVYYIASNSEDMFTEYSSEKILESVAHTQDAFNSQAAKTDGSFFTLGDFGGGVGDLVRLAPIAIGTTFFRPFLWESRNLIMVLSALEGLLLLLFTLNLFISKRGFFVFVKQFFTNSLVFYCFSFSVVFAVFVGISTFNFGSLARYKMPCIPFYFMSILITFYKTNPNSRLFR